MEGKENIMHEIASWAAAGTRIRIIGGRRELGEDLPAGGALATVEKVLEDGTVTCRLDAGGYCFLKWGEDIFCKAGNTVRFRDNGKKDEGSIRIHFYVHDCGKERANSYDD